MADDNKEIAGMLMDYPVILGFLRIPQFGFHQHPGGQKFCIKWTSTSLRYANVCAQERLRSLKHDLL
jgi:hypothetical protein